MPLEKSGVFRGGLTVGLTAANEYSVKTTAVHRIFLYAGAKSSMSALGGTSSTDATVHHKFINV